MCFCLLLVCVFFIQMHLGCCSGSHAKCRCGLYLARGLQFGDPWLPTSFIPVLQPDVIKWCKFTRLNKGVNDVWNRLCCPPLWTYPWSTEFCVSLWCNFNTNSVIASTNIKSCWDLMFVWKTPAKAEQQWCDFYTHTHARFWLGGFKICL